MDNAQLQQQIDDLKAQVEELKTWKEEKDAQQLSYPLDDVSKSILEKDFFRLTELVTYYGGASGTASVTALTRVDDQDLGVPIVANLMNFSVDPATNLIYPAKPFYLETDWTVYFSSTDTLPAGLDSTVITYYVINPTTTSFQVSASAGGAAIDITSAGVGSHYVETYGTF